MKGEALLLGLIRHHLRQPSAGVILSALIAFGLLRASCIAAFRRHQPCAGKSASSGGPEALRCGGEQHCPVKRHLRHTSAATAAIRAEQL
eukprot:598970-Pelagomonas_calceolata.AAC.7